MTGRPRERQSAWDRNGTVAGLRTSDSTRRRDHRRVHRDRPIRLSELAAIRHDPDEPARSDLDLHPREIRITEKARKPRAVKIGHQTARSLDRYLHARARHPHAWRPQLWLGVKSRGPLTPAGIYQITARRGRQLLTGGLRIRTAALIPLEKVTGLTLQRTVLGRLLGYGTLIVTSDSRHQPFREVRYLPYPEQLYLEISALLPREEQGGIISPQARDEGMTAQDSPGPLQQE